jgi:hypothetical protein
MNTSIIKKETADKNIQPEIKITRRITGNGISRKNDLVTILHEENDSLYEECRQLIKRNIELRTIVEKQQKLINAIYNAELQLVFPAEEKNPPEEIKTEPMQEQTAKEPESLLPVISPGAPEAELPEIKLPQPLDFNSLAKRIFSLTRKRWQSRKTLVDKTKLLLILYNSPSRICYDDFFAQLGITRQTGMRHLSFFKKFSFVYDNACHGITDMGKKFVEGEKNPEWDKFRNYIKNWRVITSS